MTGARPAPARLVGAVVGGVLLLMAAAAWQVTFAPGLFAGLCVVGGVGALSAGAPRVGAVAIVVAAAIGLIGWIAAEPGLGALPILCTALIVGVGGVAALGRAPMRTLLLGGAAVAATLAGAAMMAVQGGGAPGFALGLLGLAQLAELPPLAPWSSRAAMAPALIAVAVRCVAVLTILALRSAGDAAADAVDILLFALGAIAVVIGAARCWLDTPDAQMAGLCRGLVLIAFGLGGTSGEGLVLLASLMLIEAACVVAPLGSAARTIARAALAGAPPGGVFTGAVLIVGAVAARSLPFGAALAAFVVVGAVGLLRDVAPPGPIRFHLADLAAWALLVLAVAPGLLIPAAIFAGLAP